VSFPLSKPRFTTDAPDPAALGADISALPDLDPRFQIQTGTRVLAEALVRRLQTSRGTLSGTPAYGDDIRQQLNGAMTQQTLFEIKTGIERECLSDSRVLTAAASLDWSAATETLTIGITATSADGPFRLVLAVSALTIAILAAQ